MSLDEAIRIALENAHVVRTLSGLSVVPSGQTIYDAAIVNTTIDQQQARFDPVLSQSNVWSRTNVPFGVLDPFNPFESLITGAPTDAYQSQLGLTKTNVLGGQWALNWTENPTRVKEDGLPLNPENPTAVSIGYTQPLLQGAGFAVNTAPIVIARLNTERSYFQYKDSVQEMVRGVIEGYWNLVQGRIDVWARRIQVEQSEYAFKLAKAQAQVRPGQSGGRRRRRASPTASSRRRWWRRRRPCWRRRGRCGTSSACRRKTAGASCRPPCRRANAWRRTGTRWFTWPSNGGRTSWS